MFGYERKYSKGFRFIWAEMNSMNQVEHYAISEAPMCGEFKCDSLPVPAPFRQYSRVLTDIEKLQRVYNNMTGINYK